MIQTSNQTVPWTLCGGKGNRGRFVEREKRICTAGLVSKDADKNVSQCFEHYTLQDHADALLRDTIFPPEKPQRFNLIKPPPPDARYLGSNTEIRTFLNPPIKSNIENIVNDLRETVYDSFWNKPLGQVRDPKPNLPPEIDVVNTKFGKSSTSDVPLYEIILPSVELPGQTPPSASPGLQARRKYEQPFDPNLTYGKRNLNADTSGRKMKCSLQDDRFIIGVEKRNITSSVQADYDKRSQYRLGEPLRPNDIELMLPECHVFGMSTKANEPIAASLVQCELNPSVVTYKESLGHLNSVRKNLSKTVLPTFYRKFNLILKYHDKESTGWIPKEIVYEECAKKLIRFDQSLIEYILSHWNAFDGKYIKYEFFVHILNFKEPVPPLPRLCSIPPEELRYDTEYQVMTKPGQYADDRPTAGIPSRRIDLDYVKTPKHFCRAAKINLPAETEMKGCITSSVMAMFNVNQRDMYASREPSTVRRIFEAANGKPYTDEEFSRLWARAQRKHSEGLVCYETFNAVCLEVAEEEMVVEPLFVTEHGFQRT